MAVSWDAGPANSRLVRGLLYLAYDSFGGVLVFAGVAVLVAFGPALDRPFRNWREMLPVVVGLLLLALVRYRSFAALRTEDTPSDDLLASYRSAVAASSLSRSDSATGVDSRTSCSGSAVSWGHKC